MAGCAASLSLCTCRVHQCKDEHEHKHMSLGGYIRCKDDHAHMSLVGKMPTQCKDEHFLVNEDAPLTVIPSAGDAHSSCDGKRWPERPPTWPSTLRTGRGGDRARMRTEGRLGQSARPRGRRLSALEEDAVGRESSQRGPSTLRAGRGGGRARILREGRLGPGARPCGRRLSALGEADMAQTTAVDSPHWERRHPNCGLWRSRMGCVE